MALGIRRFLTNRDVGSRRKGNVSATMGIATVIVCNVNSVSSKDRVDDDTLTIYLFRSYFVQVLTNSRMLRARAKRGFGLDIYNSYTGGQGYRMAAHMILLRVIRNEGQVLVVVRGLSLVQVAR